MKAFLRFFKSETVFCVSLCLAVLSAFAVQPDAAYLAYPDYRTLALLFSLMIIVAGFRSLGVFDFLGQSLLKKAGSLRRLSVTMVLLCFGCSMVITNDVTLITFVPFTILVFRMIGEEERILKVVVLETIAANLGSMATPIGNPQNLYLYSAFPMTFGQFAWAVLPYAALSLALLLAVLLKDQDRRLVKAAAAGEKSLDWARLKAPFSVYCLLLALCLLVVFRVLPYGPVIICVAAVMYLVNRRLFGAVDYFLLLTFVCFFIFIGNVKRIPAISGLLSSLVEGRELWAGILASQVISNVPAAILLAGFTENAPALLTGVNLGGLGTLIASLASLISFKFFSRDYPWRKGAFMKTFTLWNLIFLAVLIAAAVLLAAVSPAG